MLNLFCIVFFVMSLFLLAGFTQLLLSLRHLLYVSYFCCFIIDASQFIILVVLHHTYDREHVVPDSNKYKNDKIYIVNCLFHEDGGLLKDCEMNTKAIKQTRRYIKDIKVCSYLFCCFKFTVLTCVSLLEKVEQELNIMSNVIINNCPEKIEGELL